MVVPFIGNRVFHKQQCWHYCQLCVLICWQFSSLFTITDVNKCGIRNLGGLDLNVAYCIGLADF